MTIIERKGDYRIELYGNDQYFIIGGEDTIYDSKNTERKARNALARILRDSGFTENKGK